jgi:hypothetical protein
MNAEAAKLRRQLERYRLRLQSSTDPRTVKALRALMAQIEMRLREIGSNKSESRAGAQLGSTAIALEMSLPTDRA